MRRMLKGCLIGGAVAFILILLLGYGAMRLAQKGISPLVEGQQMQGGAVTVVVDATSPSPVAAYLIRLADGGLALVDAGMDIQAKALVEALHRAGRSEADVTAIFLTHGHGDHAGGLQRFPQAQIYGLDLDPTLRPAGSLPAMGQRLTRLHDGEIIRCGGTPVEAFALPGHTADSGAFLVHGVLFLGDSAAGQYNGKIGGAPPFLSIDRARSHRELANLARRLAPRRQDIAWLAFGHQGPLAGAAPLLTWAKVP